MKILFVKIAFTTICLLSLFSLIIKPTPSLGATDTGITGSDINVDLTPENPQPYSDITINLSSYATDLNKANIQWKNGKNILLSGYGKTSYSFKTFGSDVGISFSIVITPADSGASITKNITINPQEVNVLWESMDGYTPPFYRGKSFVSPEGMIKVVAIPNSSTLGSFRGKVTYTWKNGDKTDLGMSGYNKDSYVFKNSNLNDQENIGVQASSLDGSYNAANNVTIPIINPLLIFYKKSPTEGVLYSQALIGETPVPEDEVTIVAVPYFMSIKGQSGYLDYKWQVNGNDISTPSKKTELTLHPTSHGGYADINLAIENANLIFQKISAQLKLNL